MLPRPEYRPQEYPPEGPQWVQFGDKTLDQTFKSFYHDAQLLLRAKRRRMQPYHQKRLAKEELVPQAGHEDASDAPLEEEFQDVPAFQELPIESRSLLAEMTPTPLDDEDFGTPRERPPFLPSERALTPPPSRSARVARAVMQGALSLERWALNTMDQAWEAAPSMHDVAQATVYGGSALTTAVTAPVVYGGTALEQGMDHAWEAAMEGAHAMRAALPQSIVEGAGGALIAVSKRSLNTLQKLIEGGRPRSAEVLAMLDDLPGQASSNQYVPPDQRYSHLRTLDDWKAFGTNKQVLIDAIREHPKWRQKLGYATSHGFAPEDEGGRIRAGLGRMSQEDLVETAYDLYSN